MTYTIRIVSGETGEVFDREMTNEESNALELLREQSQQEKRLAAEATAAKVTLLNKLGITEEEAKLLLGGN